MARLQKRNLSQPDEARPVGRGRLEVVEIGDAAFGRISATTNALLFGSGINAVSRGSHSLKGIEQPVELFAVG